MVLRHLFMVVIVFFLGSVVVAVLAARATSERDTKLRHNVSSHFGSDWVIDGTRVYHNENLEIVSVGYASDTQLIVAVRWKSATNTVQVSVVIVENNRDGITLVGIPDSELRAKVQAVAKR